MYDADGGEVVCVMSLSQPSGAGGEGQGEIPTTNSFTEYNSTASDIRRWNSTTGLDDSASKKTSECYTM